MTLPHKDRGIIGAVSFETLVNDPTLVLQVNSETTQKLLHVLVTEIHRLRVDIQELHEALVSEGMAADAA